MFSFFLKIFSGGLIPSDVSMSVPKSVCSSNTRLSFSSADVSCTIKSPAFADVPSVPFSVTLART